MKLVIAIVRPEKLNDVLEALYRAEVRGLTISRVRGHGGETEEVETYRGVTVKVEVLVEPALFVDVTVLEPLAAALAVHEYVCEYGPEVCVDESEPKTVGNAMLAIADSESELVAPTSKLPEFVPCGL